MTAGRVGIEEGGEVLVVGNVKVYMQIRVPLPTNPGSQLRELCLQSLEPGWDIQSPAAYAHSAPWHAAGDCRSQPGSVRPSRDCRQSSQSCLQVQVWEVRRGGAQRVRDLPQAGRQPARLHAEREDGDTA